jgi:D-3-phosphoglycerate dehydrogenase
MAAKKILVPNLLLGDAAERFEAAGHEVIYALPPQWRGHPRLTDEDGERRAALLEQSLGELLPEASALHAIGLGAQLPVDGNLLDLAPDLDVVFVPSAGTDAIDLAACTERGIVVVNAAGNNYVSVAEHAIGLMLSLTRQIAFSDRLAHARARPVTQGDLEIRPSVLRGKTVGVVGFGFTGREVARICRDGFGMEVLAFDPYFNPTEAERQGVRLIDTLLEMLSASDVVSVHLPLTPQSRHLVDADALRAMRPTAILVNTSRGSVVDPDALQEALESRAIAGAGLDVTEPDQLPAGHPLFSCGRAVLTPHIAGSAPEMAARAGRMSADDTLRALVGERPVNLVNPEVWPAYLGRVASDGPAS